MSRYCLKCPSSPWQWSKLSPVVWPTSSLSPSALQRCTCTGYQARCRSSCGAEKDIVYYDYQRIPHGSRLHLLHSSQSRAKTWSPHLFWQPWAGKRISICMGGGAVRPNGSVSWQRVLKVRDCASFGCFHSVLRDQLHLQLFSTHPSANRNHPATLEFHFHRELQNLPALPLDLYILC